MLGTLSGLLTRDLAIDLGTSHTRIWVRGRGVACREPSFVAVREGEEGRRRVVAVGSEARALQGRTPAGVQVVRPIREGVVADFQATEDLLGHLIRRVQGGRSFLSLRAVVAIPFGTTEIEKRAVRDSAEAAGVRHVSLVEQPIAAALGAGLDISRPDGNLVADIGGGTTEVAVLSLGGIVHSHAARVGGDHLDQALLAWVEAHHGLLLGSRTAEDLRIRLGSALPGVVEGAVEVRGRDVRTGFPRAVQVTASEIVEALEDPLTHIVDVLRRALDRTPPELVSDIVDKGIVLTGGCALFKGLDERIRRVTGLPVIVADDPYSTVVTGAGKVLEDAERWAGALT
ncbi:MAG: rod shape-determining protein [Deltaproteobacteria bacterium]|nr:rod shape-determining protein [Deltaproteobacteria bacterium]